MGSGTIHVDVPLVDVCRLGVWVCDSYVSEQDGAVRDVCVMREE